MTFRSIVLMTVACAFATATQAAEPSRTDTPESVAAATESGASLTLTIFDPCPQSEVTTIEADGSLSMPTPNNEVVIARINPDGTVSRACVETEPAARAFFNGTTGRVQAGRQER